jgi:hypothetical protein
MALMAVPPTAMQWLFRAEEAKNLAEVLNDPKAKQSMLRIALGYERLAEYAVSVEQSRLPRDGGY